MQVNPPQKYIIYMSMDRFWTGHLSVNILWCLKSGLHYENYTKTHKIYSYMFCWQIYTLARIFSARINLCPSHQDGNHWIFLADKIHVGHDGSQAFVITLYLILNKHRRQASSGWSYRMQPQHPDWQTQCFRGGESAADGCHDVLRLLCYESVRTSSSLSPLRDKEQ